jgi:glycosyltransferase involved in cell wall biosynthesis
MEITYVTSELPFPVSHGGLMATHCVIQALAPLASVSLVVLTPGQYSDAAVREAENYYRKICRSFVCHQFPHLNPSSSMLVKAWHYLTGYPRHGFWSKEADRILAEQMRKTGCEVLWCNSTYEAKYLSMARKMKCKTVMMTHNVESDLVRQQMPAEAGKSRLIGWIRWLDMRRLEKMGARGADLVTGITSVDHEYYVRLKGADRAFLLPFGYRVSENGAHADQSREEPHTICFIGSMDWLPNVVAARYLVNQIMPLVWQTIPEATCFIVGRNPAEEVKGLASERVTITGTVPSVCEYYERASVVVVPVQEVSGVKIKLIEAMGVGKAVVTTSAGAAGIKVDDGTQVMVANEPQEFADAVIKLIKNKPERERLGKEARRFVMDHLSPRETETQVEKILEALNRL